MLLYKAYLYGQTWVKPGTEIPYWWFALNNLATYSYASEVDFKRLLTSSYKEKVRPVFIEH